MKLDIDFRLDKQYLDGEITKDEYLEKMLILLEINKNQLNKQYSKTHSSASSKIRST